MANIPLQYPFPYKTINSTGFTSSVEFVNVTVLGDVTIDQNLTVSGNITTTDLTVGDDLTVGGQIDAQVLRAFGVWDTPIQTVNGAGAWIGFDASGHTIFANRKSTAGQTNSFRWYAFDHTNAFQGELMRLSNAGNLFVSGTKIEFPLVHFQQPPGTFPQYDFILPSSMGGAGQVLTSAGAGSPTYWTTPSGGGGGGGGTVTNVTGTSPVTVTSPTTTPNISLGTIPTTLGGTGLTTVGTNGQVLSSNGTSLQYVTLPTPVTSVAATSPLASSGGATPTISIASSTGTGAVVLASFPIVTGLISDNSLFTRSVANDTYVITSAAGGAFGYIEATDISTAVKRSLCLNPYGGNVGVGTTSPTDKLNVVGSTKLNNGSFKASNTADDVEIVCTAIYGNFGAINARQASNTGVPKAFCINPYGGDVGIGTTSPTARLDVLTSLGTTTCRLKGTPESLILDGTDYVYQRFALAGVNSAYVGYGNAGNNNFDISNTIGNIVLFPNNNVGIGTTTPAAKLHVSNGEFRVSQDGTGVAAVAKIQAGTSGSPSVANEAQLQLITVGGGGGFVTTYLLQKYSATYGYHHLSIADNFVSSSPIWATNSINVVNSVDCNSKIESNGGNTALELRAINGTAYIDMTAKTPSPGLDYDFRISKTNSNDVNFLNAHSGSFIFDKGVRATNFSTNGVQAFTYASGTFTPRIAMFYTIDGKVYECNSAPAGRDNISITYTVQTGLWVRIGNTVMVNMEIQYNQTYSGIFFSMNDLNIVAVIPETACNPSGLGAAGVTGYPSRIRDRFVDNFQMNYWISNTAYAPGGTICEVQLRRDNTHNMCPWDPTNKTGERVNITASYYVNQ